MVDNFVLWTWDVTKESKHRSIHERAEKKAEKIAQVVNRRENKTDISIMEHLGPVVFNYKGFIKRVNAGDKSFYSTRDCNSCGLCAKGCSVNNIEMVNGNPKWLSQTCQRCLTCLHLCPKRSIQFGKKTIKRNRYRNPILRLMRL